ETQTLSQRGFLLRHHVPGDGIPSGDVHGAVCDSAHRGMAVAVGRVDERSGAKNCAPAPSLYGACGARIHAARQARTGSDPRRLSLSLKIARCSDATKQIVTARSSSLLLFPVA